MRIYGAELLIHNIDHRVTIKAKKNLITTAQNVMNEKICCKKNKAILVKYQENTHIIYRYKQIKMRNIKMNFT